MGWTKWSNSWPPESIDITLLDFFLWGFVKDIIYRKKVSNVDDLKARITAVIVSVDMDMFARTWREIDYRLDSSLRQPAHVRKYIGKGRKIFRFHLTISIINWNLSSLFYELLNIKTYPTFL